MKNILDIAARLLAKSAYFSAVSGAGRASSGGIYQPKTPKSLIK